MAKWLKPLLYKARCRKAQQGRAKRMRAVEGSGEWIRKMSGWEGEPARVGSVASSSAFTRRVGGEGEEPHSGVNHRT